jgi:hypothetical protein
MSLLSWKWKDVFLFFFEQTIGWLFLVGRREEYHFVIGEADFVGWFCILCDN